MGKGGAVLPEVGSAITTLRYSRELNDRRSPKNAGIGLTCIRDTLLLLKFQLFHTGSRAVDLFPSFSVDGLLLPSEREVNCEGSELCSGGGYGMILEDRERMEYLCKRIAVEKSPPKLEKLALELNDLVSATLKSVQAKPKRKKRLSNDEHVPVAD